VPVAVAHPFSDGHKAGWWIGGVAIRDEERAQITHENAERLLGLQAVPAPEARPR
jgi:hypothetical protein